jgi:hypothetical protein
MLTCKTGMLAETAMPLIAADIPTAFHGWTGIGKTMIAHNEIRKALQEFCQRDTVVDEFRMSHIPLEDTSGVPVVKDMRTVWTCPGLVPVDDDRMHLIYYGEAGHIDTPKQHVLYGACNERTIGGYRLPKYHRIILDLNTREDKGGDIRLLRPFENRLAHVFVELDHAGWIRRQIERGTHPMLIAFMKIKGEYLHYMLDRDNDGRVKEPQGPAFPTPRSIENLDKVHKLPFATNAVVVNAARALLGEKFARDYGTFLRDAGSKLPKLSEIKANPTGAKVPDDLDQQWVIASAVAHTMVKADAEIWAQYLERLSPDIAARAAHTAMQRDSSLSGVAKVKALV